MGLFVDLGSTKALVDAAISICLTIGPFGLSWNIQRYFLTLAAGLLLLRLPLQVVLELLDLILQLQYLIGVVYLGLFVRMRQLNNTPSIFRYLLILLSVLSLQMMESKAQFLQFSLQLLDLLRGLHHLALHVAASHASNQLPEKPLGLLVLVVVLDVVLHFFEQVDVWTEQIDDGFRSCDYLLFEDVVGEVDEIEEVTCA